MFDKDLLQKWYIDNIDGSVSFSVSENGFWPLDFTVVGDADIEHSDIVKVIDTEWETIEQVISNDDFLTFDGSNDYVQSWTSIARRWRWYNPVWLTGSSDWYGNYYTNFADYTWYIDIWLPFDEIAINKSFSMKFIMQTASTNNNRILFYHNDFAISQTLAWEIVVWFEWGSTKSFTLALSTYYRIVVTYNGTTISVWYNSISAVWSTALSLNNEKYCAIGNWPLWNNTMWANAKRYTLCMRDRVLSGWEVTSENWSHAVVTTSNRFFNINASILWTDTVDNVIDTGIVSWVLTTSTNICISWRFKLWIDAVDTANSQNIVVTPYVFVQCRTTSNNVVVWYDNAWLRSSTYSIGNGNRTRHHFVAVAQNTWSTRQTQLYVDWVLRDTDNHAVAPSTKYIDYIELARRSTTYFNGSIKDIRIHTFTWALNANDALRLYQWINPQETTAIIEYARYDMNEGTGTILSNKATIYNGAVWNSDNTAPFVQTHNRVVEQEIYYGQVIKITPTLQSNQGKRTIVSCLWIQTTLNDTYFRWPTGLALWNEALYPNNVLQFVYDQNKWKYLDYTGDDIMDYPDYLRDRRFTRTNLFVDNTVDGIDMISKISAGSDMIIEKRFPISPVWVGYIFQFRAKSDSWNKTIQTAYKIEGDSYFANRTYTVWTERTRISFLWSRSWVSWSAIVFKLSINWNIFLKDFKIYRENDSTVPRIGIDILDINYNNQKCIKARQDALEYSGAKIKRTTDMYPIAFNPNIANIPDHYFIEEKHLSFLEKWIGSDEIVNSVQVEYDWGTTTSIEDATSIWLYRKREWIISSYLWDSTSANSYWQVYLAKNKDPKAYIKAVVTRAYPIHTIRVGDLCQINWNSLAIERWYITRLDMNETTCTIYLDHYDWLWKSLSKI